MRILNLSSSSPGTIRNAIILLVIFGSQFYRSIVSLTAYKPQNMPSIVDLAVSVVYSGNRSSNGTHPLIAVLENNSSTRPPSLFGVSIKDYDYDTNNHIIYDRANNTIITAFFRLSTKRHTQEDYDQLLEKLASLDDPMIIYTSPDLVSKFTALRADKMERTMVIPLHLNETAVANQFPIDTWKWAHGKFANKAGTHEVFWIWHAKVELLHQGAQLNPFGSTFFAWVDAGMVRWPEYANKTLLERIPPELPSDK